MYVIRSFVKCISMEAILMCVTLRPLLYNFYVTLLKVENLTIKLTGRVSYLAASIFLKI